MINIRNNHTFADLLPSLRSKDILMIRDLTLGTWNNLVYGQSIHPSRGSTKVDLLGRDGLMLVVFKGNMDKVNRVVSWTRNNLLIGCKKGDDDLPSDSLPQI